MQESILRDKSFAFALRVVKLYRHLVEQREFVLSKQVLRSGTSIGANLEEALNGQSRNDFIHKLSIAQKEAGETNYWIRLLRESEMLERRLADSVLEDCLEIQKMLTASLKTAKRNNSPNLEN